MQTTPYARTVIRNRPAQTLEPTSCKWISNGCEIPREAGEEHAVVLVTPNWICDESHASYKSSFASVTQTVAACAQWMMAGVDLSRQEMEHMPPSRWQGAAVQPQLRRQR